MSNFVHTASLAIQYDKEKNIQKAIDCYRSAAKQLEIFIYNDYANIPPDLREQYKYKIKEYSERAATLESNNDVKALSAQFGQRLALALNADEAGNKQAAMKYYEEALQMAVDQKLNKTGSQETKDILERALIRAEELKGIHNTKAAPTLSISKNPVAVAPLQSIRNTNLKPDKHVYTEEEKAVLWHTSTINNNRFLPFLELDLNEKFVYDKIGKFEDPEGTLKLAAKQMREFDRWVTPEELCDDPKMVAGPTVDCYTVKQTIVSDCSFIASLTVSGLYEKRFNRKLITSIIYPRNRHDQPCYNPYGKYMVKLHVNGIRRKVIIDDKLPFSKYRQLLCSYSSIKNELWVSLLEKAYMKVMGGYDFPGSNSNTDLHALTGWIPERCAIRRNEADFDSDALFHKICHNLEIGNLLATVATGPLDPATEERTGLAATHAYAVLDIKEAQGKKLLKLKNPWSHTEWKGNYSDNSDLWTPELRRLVNYEPHSSISDDGVFWIDYRSIIQFFDVFYLNWNPDMFKATLPYCVHQWLHSASLKPKSDNVLSYSWIFGAGVGSIAWLEGRGMNCTGPGLKTAKKWDAKTGPLKDSYSVGENPQYSLDIDGKGEVWLLLTRHITTIEDFRDNQEYITLLVYNTNGRRVYYPHDPPPHIDGVRINSPHYLCKVYSDSRTRVTLVVSQFEKKTTIYYTLRAYGTCKFSLKKLETLPLLKHITDEWTSETAGGCENHPASYPKNPKYMVTIPVTPTILVTELRGPRQYDLGVSVAVKALDDPALTAPFHTKSSGNYRSGFVVLELLDLPAGKYLVTVATFLPGQLGHFFLDFRASSRISVTKLI